MMAIIIPTTEPALHLMNLIALQDLISPSFLIKKNLMWPHRPNQRRGRVRSLPRRNWQIWSRAKLPNSHLSQRIRFYPLHLGQNLLLSRNNWTINRWYGHLDVSFCSTDFTGFMLCGTLSKDHVLLVQSFLVACKGTASWQRDAGSVEFGAKDMCFWWWAEDNFPRP